MPDYEFPVISFSILRVCTCVCLRPCVKFGFCKCFKLIRSTYQSINRTWDAHARGGAGEKGEEERKEKGKRKGN